VVYGWREGAKWGFFAPYTHSRDPKIGPTSIYQTVSIIRQFLEEVFSETGLPTLLFLGNPAYG
jgi:hypothetical protein